MRARCLALLLAFACGVAQAQGARAPAAPQGARAPAASEGAAGLSSAAERVYAGARPRLLQVRTLLSTGGRQSSIGSGFLVSADGMAVTNYHVVSQFTLDPATYRLEYAAPDGTRGTLKVLAIDVVNDLALVRLESGGRSFFEFDRAALAGTLPKGERLFAMGNPLDLGFTIVEGTYNGPVERSYNERLHLSGALNPGMSGGPTVNSGGRVAGINVAKRLGSELVSFLVPARFAAQLLDRAKSGPAFSPEATRAEIDRQLTDWQEGLYREIRERGFRESAFGPYRAPESAAPWFSCWARTNADDVPRPRATVNATQCTTDTGLFIAGDLLTGGISMSHSYAKSVDLNAFQFAAFLSQHYRVPKRGRSSRKWLSREFCHENFVAAENPGDRPPLRAVWCARAYRDLAGLYDVSVLAVTQDRSREAVVSRLVMEGVSFANATDLTKTFLGALRWEK